MGKLKCSTLFTIRVSVILLTLYVIDIRSAAVYCLLVPYLTKQVARVLLILVFLHHSYLVSVSQVVKILTGKRLDWW